MLSVWDEFLFLQTTYFRLETKALFLGVEDSWRAFTACSNREGKEGITLLELLFSNQDRRDEGRRVSRYVLKCEGRLAPTQLLL